MSSGVSETGLVETYKKSAQKAHDDVSKNCTQLNYALGQEALADIGVWSQSLYHLLEYSLVTQSFDTLVEGWPAFESTLYTIPIIGPLAAERISAGNTRQRIEDESHSTSVLLSNMTKAD